MHRLSDWMRTRLRRCQESDVYKLGSVAPNTKKARRTHACLFPIKALRAPARGLKPTMCACVGSLPFGCNVAIAMLGRGDEGLGPWFVGIEFSRHEWGSRFCKLDRPSLSRMNFREIDAHLSTKPCAPRSSQEFLCVQDSSPKV